MCMLHALCELLLLCFEPDTASMCSSLHNCCSAASSHLDAFSPRPCHSKLTEIAGLFHYQRSSFRLCRH